jgi:hypothetical protein
MPIAVGIRESARILGPYIVIHQDALPVAIEIFELPAARCPEQYDDGNQPQNDHPGNESIDDFHRITSLLDLDRSR